MPYALRRTRRGFGVINTETREWKSRDIPRQRALAQMRLLYGIEHGWVPRGRRRRRRAGRTPGGYGRIARALAERGG